jgi:hypothetical protein
MPLVNLSAPKNNVLRAANNSFKAEQSCYANGSADKLFYAAHIL